MNKSLFFILLSLTLFCSNALAYDYKPFVEEGKVWHMAFSTFDWWETFEEYTYDYDYFIEGDTVIAGIACKKLYSYNQDNTGTTCYKLAMYESQHRVYTFSNGSQEPELLYDFNIAVGDELNVTSPWMREMVLTECKLINMRGVDRRAFYLKDNELPDELYKNGWWVEGVGSELGPLNPIGFGADGNYHSFLSCELNGEVICEGWDFNAFHKEEWQRPEDINNDGFVDIDDVNTIINRILGKE